VSLALPKGESRAVLVHGMKACRGAEVWLHSFLSFAPDGGEQSALGTGRLTIGKEAVHPLSRRRARCEVCPSVSF
jgi:hypothetical protein